MTSLPPLHANDPDSRLLHALRTLGGVPASSDPFSFEWKGASITIRQTPGSTSSIELRTPYPGSLGTNSKRPLAIALRAEDDADREAKRKGISVEAQIGDATFDDAIYIETPAEPELAAHVLGTREVRAAVLSLLRTGFQDLVIDDAAHDIYLRIYATAHVEAWEADPSRLLDLLAAIAAYVPPHEELPERREDSPVSVIRAVLLGVAVASVIFARVALQIAPAVCRGGPDDFFATHIFDASACWTPYAAGLVIAGLVTAAGLASFSRFFRGRADSHRRLIALPLLLLIAGVPFGVAVSMFAFWS